MSFRVIAKGHRFAIDGELHAAIRREREQLAHSGSGGAPLANRSLGILHEAVQELLKSAPHESDVEVDLWGERDANGLGAVQLKVSILTPAAETVTPREALLEERGDAGREDAR